MVYNYIYNRIKNVLSFKNVSVQCLYVCVFVWVRVCVCSADYELCTVEGTFSLSLSLLSHLEYIT